MQMQKIHWESTLLRRPTRVNAQTQKWRNTATKQTLESHATERSSNNIQKPRRPNVTHSMKASRSVPGAQRARVRVRPPVPSVGTSAGCWEDSLSTFWRWNENVWFIVFEGQFATVLWNLTEVKKIHCGSLNIVRRTRSMRLEHSSIWSSYCGCLQCHLKYTRFHRVKMSLAVAAFTVFEKCFHLRAVVTVFELTSTFGKKQNAPFHLRLWFTL